MKSSNCQFPINTPLSMVHHWVWYPSFVTGFRSVVVITSALHAEGRRFEPGRGNKWFIFFFDETISCYLTLWKFWANEKKEEEVVSRTITKLSKCNRLFSSPEAALILVSTKPRIVTSVRTRFFERAKRQRKSAIPGRPDKYGKSD